MSSASTDRSSRPDDGEMKRVSPHGRGTTIDNTLTAFEGDARGQRELPGERRAAPGLQYTPACTRPTEAQVPDVVAVAGVSGSTTAPVLPHV